MSEFIHQQAGAMASSECRERLLRGECGLWQLPEGPLEVRGEARIGRLLMAHGAGAGQDSTFLQRLRDDLAVAGVQTLAIEFGYLQRMRREGRRRPPPGVNTLVEEMAVWCDLLSHPELPPLWLGGKSMGGRVASLLAARDGAPGLVLCGYPFHRPGRPERLRLDHWPQLACPTLVVQGSRDPFGTREEVAGYVLPEAACLHWLEDGDHDWKPRRASGTTQVRLIEAGAAAIAGFMGEHGGVDAVR
ncbi:MULTISPECIES: alpha/beta family hydrolase [unclassified Halomonas]|uniref:alpha/beta family hydrolase n=1 Tax=unclassified Halomonas TaxID=2609666 RepID=UPI00288606A5|nr:MULTISPECIES: alpha/beta family hydrolase [unclassified Halomonas]MDT0502485.1 alpha/beta family hydrolase [Halomonas sp. PAR7]MDT0511828.1 alpha/beta family hydrolase [Halomonas sp. LES1]MDT0593097.1 alpha/beta family hydrolase [Halomonas sp. PAR8]